MQVVGTPVTIKIPSAAIRKTLQLSIPVSSSPFDISNFVVCLFNGETYFPVEHTLNADRITVNIDKIDWENSDDKGTALISEIVIIGLINKQESSLD